MMTLTQLTHLETGDYYAIWRDSDDQCPDLAHRVGALHDSSGYCLAANLGLKPPRLTADQMASAASERHPAYALAQKGADARPDLAQRMQAAADLVANGQVTLYDDGSADVASRSSDEPHRCDEHNCDCRDFYYRRSWCAHRLARRMALALGQPEQIKPEAAAVGAAVVMANGMKRRVDVDTMHSQIYRQMNRQRYGRRRTLTAQPVR